MSNELKYYELTTPQKSILYTEEYFNATSINNVSGVIHYTENMNVNILKKAIEYMYTLNESLRTRIVKVDNRYKQFFSDEKNVVDIIKVSKEDKDRIIKSLCLKPFKLINSSLAKFYILKYPDNKVDVVSVSHHIICDAWTCSMYTNEIARIYYLLKHNKSIDDTTFSYSNFISTESDYLNSDSIENDKKYWNEEFSVEPKTQFFNVSNSPNGKRLSYTVDENYTSKIKNFCKLYGISEQCLFMSVISIYFAKFSSSENIAIGMPVLNRKNKTDKQTMGMFIQTLPLFLNIKRNMNIIEFIKFIQSKQFSFLKHHRYPYEFLQKDIKDKFDTTQKLYTVAFSYQNAKVDNDIPVKCDIEWIFNDYCADDIQIHIDDRNSTNCFHINFDYKSALFEKSDIDDIYNRIFYITEQIINDSNILIKDIKLITDEEQRVINGFNNTYLNYPSDKTLADIINDVALKNPLEIAVVDCKGVALTYKKLNSYANFLAHKLKDVGLKHNDVIAIYLSEKTTNLMISILASLKLGATFILLYNGLPDERIKYILNNSNAKIIITDNFNYNKFNNVVNFNIEYDISFDDVDIVDALENSVEPLPRSKDLLDSTSSQDVAYMIYTSGTTGNPKGIELTNKNLINFVYSFKNKFKDDINVGDKFISITNVSFDVCISELFTPICFGATLYLYKDISTVTVDELCKFIADNKITFSYFPPSMLNEVSDCFIKYKDELALNKMLVGVEPITHSTLQKFTNILPDLKIINGYGPSETTICSTMYNFDPNDETYEIVTIGGPIDNTKIHILNSDHNELPIGVTGELYISGDGVGKGYKNNSVLNSEKYILFNGLPTFKSGDLGKWDKNGNIIFYGRNDNQIKFRGYRIDLGEIENTLKSSNDVKNAVLILDKQLSAEDKLIAFVILQDSSIVEETLRDFLAKTLPYYMLPSKFIKLDAFPMTANGKIDKKKLLEIAASLRSEEKIVLPENEIEQKIFDVIKSKLDYENLSVNDNFFDIGLDSLEAISLTVDLKNLGYDFSLQDFYNAPTIRLLANKVHQSEPKAQVIDTDNYLKEFDINKRKPTTIDGNVFLLGSTGFLGSHLLYELISLTDKIVYCLVRGANRAQSISRLKEKLAFYFGDNFYENNKSRIVVLKGNFTESNFGLSALDYNLVLNDTTMVINSAACVKHFGNRQYFYDINFTSVKKAIDFCLENQKHFVHISTMSILRNCNTKDLLSESTLYNKQNLDNIYIATKFDAEQLIANFVDYGLSTTIFRLGNIMCRYSDGKFQENENENSFILKLKTIIKYNAVPKSLLNVKVDLSPVDLCAKSIVSILNNNEYNMYHIENNHKITIHHLIYYLRRLGYKIKVMSDKDYSRKILSLSDNSDDLFALMEKPENDVNISSKLSLKALKNCKFKWNKVDKKYLKFLL